MPHDKKEIDAYNTEVYALKWLNAADERLNSDYYKKDHFRDSLERLAKAGGTKTLECGIGTGEFFAIELARRGKNVFGIDLSGLLLTDCRSRFIKEGRMARLSIADVEKLPFKDESFDIIYAIGLMPLVTNLYETVSEMLRVTKKRGVVLFDVMNLWHVSQFINHLYKVVESTEAGLKGVNFFKSIKQSLGLKTHFKDEPERVNHKLISPPAMVGVLKKFPWRYNIMGYNVLLPLNMPVLGRLANLCDRSPLFSHGLKNHRMLKYLGSKMVIMMEKEKR